MTDLEIRPSMRLIRAGYGIAGALLIASIAWWATQRDDASLGAMVVAALLLLWPLSRHVKRQRIRCRLEGEHLRYEEGIFSTTVKTIPVAGIQDVTVSRSVTQRLWGVGDLRIETAGKSSTLQLVNVEDPQAIADKILASAKR